MRRRCRPFLLLLILAAAGPTRAADSQGRLFFTPERRAALDRQRLHNAEEQQTVDGVTLRLDGVVRRTGGPATVWVNQRPIREADAGTGLAATVPPRDPTRARLTADNEVPANLKVGQAINRATGETSDGLGGGQVRIGEPVGRRWLPP